ncbi:MAG TPA: metalloregulator ArsR/SmtB family transcription factor [Vicinamibacteria bacterium]|nr:metalloregulator ArsR/SmtB family transcription factor [Vicinamibacteria bacterium]
MAIYYRDTLDRTFHALGDETRRAMLAMLARNGEMSAGELGEPFHISQPTASKHLRVLERAGLLSRRIEGRAHRFRLRSRPLVEAEGWIARHRDFWNRTLGRLGPVLAELDEGG